ncbi:prepilin-type N-terminal cleavage/methylation domain-containing protein [Planomicrobium sp. YIM 101495]|uniref:type IV pilus modification PilV family protein n=1 Tax=Planomicrobium sp. YIM 101495 TaxID=2665160 RepID=UPI0012B77DB5|nr:type II secretion system protein [Planomicrobium sp. YIM 101495]MTD29664.1 prepilin-type N-terminal cleavage/methylation domain-containing protein [Planomicrobium sp. YIM 101495]
MKNEKGFTLVEVLASLVLISLILMGFMALFTSTNRLAVTNSEKLVVINLADSYLERAQINPEEFFSPYPLTETSRGIAVPLHEMNGSEYEVRLDVSDSGGLDLLNVIVTVSPVDSNMSSSVEGYVPYD